MAKKPIYILGINDGHLSTATLMKDGKIVAAASEERFVREKNYSGFPYKAIKYVLDSEGIKGKDVARVALHAKWGVPVFSDSKVQQDLALKIFVRLYKPLYYLRRAWGFLEYRIPFLSVFRRPLYELAFRLVGARTMEKNKEHISSLLKIKKDQVRLYEHHSSHAAAAYYTSPYNDKDALVLTIDGEGDLLSASVNTVKDGKWSRLAATSSDSSFGWLYGEVTSFLGMKKNEHEYKVMGMAPYSKEEYVNKLFEAKVKDLIRIDERNPLKFRSKFDVHMSGFYLKKRMYKERFDNIAGAFQKLVEDRLSEWVSNAIKETGITTVCLSGGVAMNVKANLKIAELPEVKEFYVCPSSGDESSPTGACYLAYLEYCEEEGVKPQISELGPLYFGPSFTNGDVKKFLSKGGYFKKYNVKYVKDIEKTIAKLVANDKIVARMAGRMEWGARALGNRSILSNPSNPDLVQVLNEQVKGRDFWMPFTPSVLKERAKDYIVNPKNIPAPYMILTFESTEKAQKEIKAAMHAYDFTVRPQLVEKDWNPGYYKIIKEFEKLTGVGAVLNTSFNLHGLPIVLGPREAMHAFENSGLKYLAMENYLIQKKN